MTRTDSLYLTILDLTGDLRAFFAEELRNRDRMIAEDGDAPEATLGTALDSIQQAPDHVRDAWGVTTQTMIDLAAAITLVGPDYPLELLT